ncbi:hypothetical protein ACP70R_043354 [Stipagrostis hirtigluma subsp. patula]
MAGRSNCTLVSFRICILLCCTLASTAITLLPLVTSPCAYTLSRTILAVTGLDPHLISCAGDDVSKAPPSNSGRPIVTDHLHCGEPDLPPHALPPFHCCPPPAPASEPVNFTFPDPAEPLRTRRPAHAAADDMAKFARAVALMKALPASDPRSFHQQASVHCAYCAGAHRQAGRPELAVQVHYSWLFFPFHRAYLYFFERIAAKLLGDPGFAVPFWSWDVPEGMRIPAEFADEASPLYDPVRNPRHAPPKVVDFDFSYVDKNYTDDEQIQLNLRIMYKQNFYSHMIHYSDMGACIEVCLLALLLFLIMHRCRGSTNRMTRMVTNAPLPSLFHGQPYRAGDAAFPGAGTVELCPHNTMHRWTGDISRPNHEDMGAYYSSARDPIFFPHHANSDRLWEVWRDIGGANHGCGGRSCRSDFTDPDWLDSSFLFYDEEARLVRVTVRDMLDVEKLRYTYAEVGMPWLGARPPTTTGVHRGRGNMRSISFPVSLDVSVSSEVRRPGRPRRWPEQEVLVIDGIEAVSEDFIKFDVYVNAVEYEKVGPGGREMAGSFLSLKHLGMEAGKVGSKTSMRVALNELLENLDAKGDDSLTVTLVPIFGKVRVGGLRIEYMTE